MPRINMKYIATIMIAGIITLAGPAGTALANGNAGSSPSSNTSKFDPAERYQEGLQQYRAGEYADAERSLKKVARATRKDANTYYVLGLSQMGLEKWRPATTSLRKAVRYNKEFHEARAQLGLVYLHRDRQDEAMEQMDELEARIAACKDACPDNLIGAAKKLRSVLSSQVSEGDRAQAYQPVVVVSAAETGDAAYLDAVRLINLGRYGEAID